MVKMKAEVVEMESSRKKGKRKTQAERVETGRLNVLSGLSIQA